MGERVEYRGYTIYWDPKPVPGNIHWSFVHKDYDGEDDPRHGYAGSIEDAKEQIDEQCEDALDKLLADFHKEVQKVFDETPATVIFDGNPS